MLNKKTLAQEMAKDSGIVRTARFVIEVDILSFVADEDDKKLKEDFKKSLVELVNNHTCCIAIRPRELTNLEAMGESLDEGT